MKKLLLFLLTAALLFVALGWDHRLKTVTYQIESEDITAPIRLVLLSDLHSCDYGEGQHLLLEAVAAARPDLVVMTGDMLDDELPLERGILTMTALAENWPCYYVTGNHDAYLAKEAAACGVTLLNEGYADVAVQGQTIRICGVADPRSEGNALLARRLEELARANAGYAGFALLLAHRPALVEQYLPGGYDLILSGHAHGGQWRIPGLLNGLIAPGEGLFPKYAGGRYDFGNTAMLVSRGLALESTRVPRLFNPPELVVIDLLPKL